MARAGCELKQHFMSSDGPARVNRQLIDMRKFSVQYSHKTVNTRQIDEPLLRLPWYAHFKIKNTTSTHRSYTTPAQHSTLGLCFGLLHSEHADVIADTLLLVLCYALGDPCDVPDFLNAVSMDPVAQSL